MRTLSDDERWLIGQALSVLGKALSQIRAPDWPRQAGCWPMPSPWAE